MDKKPRYHHSEREWEPWWHSLWPAILVSILLHYSLISSVPLPKDKEKGKPIQEVELEILKPGSASRDFPEKARPVRDKKKKPEPKPMELRPEEPKPPEKVEPSKPEEKKKEKPPELKALPDLNNKQFVDQQQQKDEGTPDDAKFLAPFDRKVDKETRALQTTLYDQGQDSEDKGEEGKDDKTDEREAKAREAVEGRTQQRLAKQQAQEKWKKVSPTTGEKLNIEPDGERIPFPEEIPGPAGEDGKPRPINLKLSWSQFEGTFGREMSEERRDAQEERKKLLAHGSKADKFAKIKAALENFIPDVQPGNQTELNARRHPFAEYITLIHRKIHRFWGDGALVNWSRSYGSDSPLNDFTRWAKLEFRILETGEVENVKVIHSSGNTVFDVAAIDAILGSSPFPPPPEILLSYDRRVYIHWRMDRDNRQCGVWNAEPYILKGPPDERPN